VSEADIGDTYNIVLVINESFGKDYLPFYGKQGRSTPFLERWIRSEKDKFVIFRNAFSNSTATDLSVPSILTGVAPYEDNEKPRRMPLLWDWAKAVGYKTVLVSSQRYTWSDFDKFLCESSADIQIYSEFTAAEQVEKIRGDKDLNN